MEENRAYSREKRSFLRKQGFYVVLFLCLLIVGTAIVLTALPSNEVTEAPPQNEQQPVVIETRQSGDDTLTAKVVNTPLPTATPSPTPSATPAPTSAPRATSSVKKGVAPVSGDIIMGYAADALIYSRTLDQWTTHAALDIAAELGSEVKAALGGTVERIYEDDALGWCVTIAHTNDRKSLYANLDETIPVKAGQKVNAGDVVACVGKSALSECADLPHLHFAFFVEDAPVDPTGHVTIPH